MRCFDDKQIAREGDRQKGRQVNTYVGIYITLIYIANHRATLPAVRHHLNIWCNYTS